MNLNKFKDPNLLIVQTNYALHIHYMIPITYNSKLSFSVTP